jgi:hypothetical protein
MGISLPIFINNLTINRQFDPIDARTGKIISGSPPDFTVPIPNNGKNYIVVMI